MKKCFVRLSFWNISVLTASFLAILLHLGEIYLIHQNWNPLLPDFAFYFAIGEQLNFLLCFVPVFAAGIVLFLLKKHLLSIILLLVHLQISLFLKEHLEWYTLFL